MRGPLFRLRADHNPEPVQGERLQLQPVGVASYPDAEFLMPIPILKAGDFVDMRGRAVSFTVDDLHAIAAAYDPAAAPAPLCVGHPKHNDPAYGWVSSLSVEDDTLQAEVGQVDAALRAANREGRYRRVSASIYPAGHPASPKPGQPYLRHVGLLGGASPAVGSLPPVNLADEDDAITLEVCDLADGLPVGPEHPVEPGPDDVTEPPSELADAAMQSMAEKDALIAQMAQTLARLQDQNVNFQAENARLLAEKYRDEAQAHIDRLVEEARMPPALAAQAVDLLVAVRDVGPVDLAGGEPLDQALRNFLSAIPPMLATTELSSPGDAPMVEDSKALAARARAMVDEAAARGERLTIPEAVRQIARS